MCVCMEIWLRGVVEVGARRRGGKNRMEKRIWRRKERRGIWSRGVGPRGERVCGECRGVECGE